MSGEQKPLEKNRRVRSAVPVGDGRSPVLSRWSLKKLWMSKK